MRADFNTLYLGFIFLLAGGLTLLMAKKGSNLNPIVGYRTSWSMKSPETWIAANRYSGRSMLLTGIISLLCGFLVWWEPLAQYGMSLVTGVMGIGIVVTLVATEKYLRRNFNADGTPKDTNSTIGENSGLAAESGQHPSTLPRRLSFSSLDYILETAALVGIILGIASVAVYYPDLPASVPQHYGAGGKVDAWGGKELVFMLPVISLVLYGFMSMIRWFSPSGSSKKISLRQWRLSLDLINWLKVLTVWTFTYLSWMTLQIALGRSHSLYPAFNPIMLGSMTVITVFYIWKILKTE